MDGSTLVRRVLDVSGLTKAELHRRSGVSRALIDAYLSGAKQPTVAQVERLARAGGAALEVAVLAPRPAPRPVSPLVYAVLELADVLPRRPARALPDLSGLWATARERAARAAA